MEVADRERIGITERALRDLRGSPDADSGQRSQSVLRPFGRFGGQTFERPW